MADLETKAGDAGESMLGRRLGRRSDRIEGASEMIDCSPHIVPGMMRCAKCSFVLVRNTLYMKSGTVGPGSCEIERCPNGCGLLWPMTWKQHAEDLEARCIEQLNRARDAEARAEPLHAALLDLVETFRARPDMLRLCGFHEHTQLEAACDALNQRLAHERCRQNRSLSARGSNCWLIPLGRLRGDARISPNLS